ncbi:unnamed protein product [Boreogadus saida]
MTSDLSGTQQKSEALLVVESDAHLVPADSFLYIEPACVATVTGSSPPVGPQYGSSSRVPDRLRWHAIGRRTRMWRGEGDGQQKGLREIQPEWNRTFTQTRCSRTPLHPHTPALTHLLHVGDGQRVGSSQAEASRPRTPRHLDTLLVGVEGAGDRTSNLQVTSRPARTSCPSHTPLKVLVSIAEIQEDHAPVKTPKESGPTSETRSGNPPPRRPGVRGRPETGDTEVHTRRSANRGVKGRAFNASKEEVRRQLSEPCGRRGRAPVTGVPLPSAQRGRGLRLSVTAVEERAAGVFGGAVFHGRAAETFERGMPPRRRRAAEGRV